MKVIHFIKTHKNEIVVTGLVVSGVAVIGLTYFVAREEGVKAGEIRMAQAFNKMLDKGILEWTDKEFVKEALNAGILRTKKIEA